MLSESMATKIAGYGLAYCHLAFAWRRDEESGIEKLLGGKLVVKSVLPDAAGLFLP